MNKEITMLTMICTFWKSNSFKITQKQSCVYRFTYSSGQCTYIIGEVFIILNCHFKHV